MSISFEFESDLPELVALFEEVGERVMPAEAAKSLNRTITFVRNEVANEVSGRTGIKRSLIRRRVKGTRRGRASSKRLEAGGFVGEEDIPVGKLTPKPRRSGRGVTHKTVTGQPVDTSAFFARGIRGRKGGRSSAFARTTSARSSLVERKIRIRPFLRRSVRRVIRKPAEEFFMTTFHSNMLTRIEKEAAKRGLKG